jgi:hypothetical protein
MRSMACLVAAMLATSIVLSGQAPSRDPAASPACSYLSRDDAAAALGETVTGPKGVSTGRGTSSCEYSGSGIHTVHLNVMAMDAATVAMYKVRCAQKGKEGLTGLGDTACWYNDKHGELQVVKGTTFFSIQLRTSGDPTEAIKGVARKVYERVK